MLKQSGMTILELMVGLSIMSGISVYVIEMTEKVEQVSQVYQQRFEAVQDFREKLGYGRSKAFDDQALTELLQQEISTASLSDADMRD